MARWLPFALIGGAVAGGFYWLGRSKSKAETPQLPPPGPPQPTPQQEEIQRLAAQAADSAQRAKALETQVANLTVSAAAAPPAQKKMLEEAAAKLLIAAASNEQQAKALKAQVVVKAQAEQAAKKVAEAQAAAGPMYPKGLTAKFSGNTAVIKNAWQDGQGNWHYKIDLDHPLPWPLKPYTLKDKEVSEVYLRQQLAEQGHITLQPGQAYAQGVEVYGANRQGGYIQKAEKNAAGEWVYTLQGWGNPVTQRELLGILTRA